ncbi:hypothetical protein NMY22_g8019 [Coprinellus aureogranulatus]|nr:hypothetical protein NMY22_g8019 [Coprinellus aureogranulatus]
MGAYKHAITKPPSPSSPYIASSIDPRLETMRPSAIHRPPKIFRQLPRPSIAPLQLEVGTDTIPRTRTAATYWKRGTSTPSRRTADGNDNERVRRRDKGIGRAEGERWACRHRKRDEASVFRPSLPFPSTSRSLASLTNNVDTRKHRFHAPPPTPRLSPTCEGRKTTTALSRSSNQFQGTRNEGDHSPNTSGCAGSSQNQGKRWDLNAGRHGGEGAELGRVVAFHPDLPAILLAVPVPTSACASPPSIHQVSASRTPTTTSETPRARWSRNHYRQAPGSENDDDTSGRKEIRHQERAEGERHANTIRRLLRHIMSPTLGGALNHIPRPYNLPGRLWALSFHALLETLRQASFSSAVAFDLVQDRLQHAYAFYHELLLDKPLLPFKSAWLEALGDLCRYRAAFAATCAVRMRGAGLDDSVMSREIRMWKEEAEEWYLASLRETPENGKLHFCIGLLLDGDEARVLRFLFHLTKSMVTQKPFHASHRSVLQIWQAEVQDRRRREMLQGLGKPTDIFIFIQGLLYTGEFGEFQTALSQLIDRLGKKTVEEEEWAMMAAINISSILDFGRGSIPLDETELIQPSAVPTIGPPPPKSPCHSYAVQLTHSMLHLAVLQQLHDSRLNPYIPITLSFLGTVQSRSSDIPASFTPLKDSDFDPSAYAPRGHSLACDPEENYYLRGMQWMGGCRPCGPEEQTSTVRAHYRVDGRHTKEAMLMAFPPRRPDSTSATGN